MAEINVWFSDASISTKIRKNSKTTEPMVYQCFAHKKQNVINFYRYCYLF